MVLRVGLGNIIKAKTGAYKLDKSLINKQMIYLQFRAGNPLFVVTLPIVEPKRRHSTMTVFDGHGHARTFDNPWLGDNTKMRKVKTKVQINAQQIIIQHALADGRHFFIDAAAVTTVGKIKNGIWIEVSDGRRFTFETDGDIRSNMWKALGFNPQFPLDVFYDLLVVPGEWQKAFVKEYQCPKCKHAFVGQLPKCPKCDMLLTYSE
ncbi:hypothetical protein [uncultured Methanobrevibacter sp.]|uniref:hypothetical protein n=1 Tax=uncultured Methanobrevibacter sp. TaxID=253161 RepID=UPI0025D499CE|nr:hypothetical protein [uncultured Methanobrevibacter sp.]